MDKETESLWFPAGGSCGLPAEAVNGAGPSCGLVGISGQYAGTVLGGENLFRDSWSDWKEKHPDTRFVRSPR